MKREMTEGDVVHIIRLLAANDVAVHIDGGWAVDALLGEQTRSHGDLDIAVKHVDVPVLRRALAGDGYAEVPRDDSWECNFVLGDTLGHEVDVHSYTLDEQGHCVFGLPYPVESLTGRGMIGGLLVDCISAPWLVQFHAGYALDDNDFRDVRALCERFALELPAAYRSPPSQW